jgi:tetratricopeptide (TPR) repeat protein
MEKVRDDHPAAALAPLSSTMAYIRIGLESLAAQYNSYDQAIEHFQHGIELAPSMALAYDNLGLCYYDQNENALASDNYKNAIELDRNSAHPSAWPYLNLAITVLFLDQLTDAEENLHSAIRLDPGLAQAHFRLGLVLEDSGRAEDAIIEPRQEARLDASYPEPYLARRVSTAISDSSKPLGTKCKPFCASTLTQFHNA